MNSIVPSSNFTHGKLVTLAQMTKTDITFNVIEFNAFHTTSIVSNKCFFLASSLPLYNFCCSFCLKFLVSISDRPKAKFKPKPKYRNFGSVWADTETETKRQSIPKPKPKPKLFCIIIF
jgi:hypothetical protein